MRLGGYTILVEQMKPAMDGILETSIGKDVMDRDFPIPARTYSCKPAGHSSRQTIRKTGRSRCCHRRD